jgi:hypothetical protein
VVIDRQGLGQGTEDELRFDGSPTKALADPAFSKALRELDPTAAMEAIQQNAQLQKAVTRPYQEDQQSFGVALKVGGVGVDGSLSACSRHYGASTFEWNR